MYIVRNSYCAYTRYRKSLHNILLCHQNMYGLLCLIFFIIHFICNNITLLSKVPQTSFINNYAEPSDIAISFSIACLERGSHYYLSYCKQHMFENIVLLPIKVLVKVLILIVDDAIIGEVKTLLAEFAVGSSSKTSTIRKITPVSADDNVQTSVSETQIQVHILMCITY